MVVKVMVVVVVALALVGVGLRLRKLRRDELRELARPVERRLMTPPPSPYAPSKGFRLLDDPTEEPHRHDPPRPRLEPDREYVFSDNQMPASEDTPAFPLRHNQEWALSRSARRSTLSFSLLRVGLIVLVLALLAGVVTYYVEGHPGKHPGTSTTTTVATTTTLKLAWPATFTPASRSGETASYTVPAERYRVVVTGSLGPSWVVYEMGSTKTLEWQGRVERGKDESLVMTGNALVTLGSPKSATVSVAGRPVIFPTPLPATLNLSFVASPSPG